MDIQQLKNFLVLCRTLNFRIASEEISIVQPALSRQIQLLEQSVGALLFKRDKRNVNLTNAGHFFKAECERIIVELEKAIIRTGQLHRGEAGEIKIGHASSAMQTILPKFLLEVKRVWPDIKNNMMEVSNRQSIEMLINRQADICIAPNVLPSAQINMKIIYEENFALIIPSTHPLATKKFTNLSAFANDDFILPPLNLGLGYVETIYQICHQFHFKPNVVHESVHSMSVQRLVEAGMGISIEPISSVKGINMSLKIIELKNTTQKVQMKLMWLKERNEELKKFLELF